VAIQNRKNYVGVARVIISSFDPNKENNEPKRKKQRIAPPTTAKYFFISFIKRLTRSMSKISKDNFSYDRLSRLSHTYSTMIHRAVIPLDRSKIYSAVWRTTRLKGKLWGDQSKKELVAYFSAKRNQQNLKNIQTYLRS
jgi:hypothetical protein